MSECMYLYWNQHSHCCIISIQRYLFGHDGWTVFPTDSSHHIPELGTASLNVVGTCFILWYVLHGGYCKDFRISLLLWQILNSVAIVQKHICICPVAWPKHDDMRIEMRASINQRYKLHDDVIKWNHFPRYWPFVPGIHRSPVSEFPAQRPVVRSFDVSLDLRLNQHLSKQWRRRWFETPSRSLWRHCNVCNDK